MTSTDVEHPDAAHPDHDHRERRPAGIRRLLPATPAQTIVGVVALMFLAGSLGYFLGAQETDTPAADSADVGFLYDMSAHHEQAVQLSMTQLANGSDPSVDAFAREIIRSQAYEIGLMRMRLGMWGFDPAERQQEPMAWMGMAVPVADAMPGMADAGELEAFREAQGSEADALFLALMSDHHAGGVAMAQDAARRADDAWVSDTADRMARIQSAEIAEMALARETAGLPANPAGFNADFGPDATAMDDMDMGDMDMEPSESHREMEMDSDDGG